MNYIAEIITAIGTIFAVFLSMAALVVSRSLQIRVRNQESAAFSLTGFASLEQMIKDVPTALKFHGITDADLRAADLTAAELSYFLSNMTTGGIYYRTTDKVSLIQFFREDGYYGEMFRQQPSRNAWILCRCCLAPSKYRDKLDSLCKHFNGPTTKLSEHLRYKLHSDNVGDSKERGVGAT